MTDLTSIWLPIIAAAFAGYILSILLWAISPHHLADFKSLPDHDAFAKAIKDLGLGHGHYKFPHPKTQADFKDETFQRYYAEGPWGGIDLIPNKPNMARNMLFTLGYFVIVSVFVGYIISESRAPGSPFIEVFQMGTTAAIMAYAMGGMLGQIWYPTITKRGFVTTLIDAALYSLATGAVFAWLWPGAPTP